LFIVRGPRSAIRSADRGFADFLPHLPAGIDGVPDVSRRTPLFLRAIANGWQISGLTTFLSGTQSGFTYTYGGSVPTGD
jgi:hypothetical protein